MGVTYDVDFLKKMDAMFYNGCNKTTVTQVLTNPAVNFLFYDFFKNSEQLKGFVNALEVGECSELKKHLQKIQGL